MTEPGSSRGIEEFRGEARAWLHANAPSKGSAEDFTGTRDEAFVAGCRRWQGKLHDNGWAGIGWPTSYGGRGLTALHDLTFRREQAQFGVSTAALDVGIGMVGPTLMAHGSDHQKELHLSALLWGREVWCQMFSEPGAGSDLASLTTAARTGASGWVVSGQKVWTSYARFADFAILLARTDPERPRHRGITCFLLDMRTPGIEVRPIKQMNGAAEFNEVFLNDVEVAAEAVLGEVNGGWAVANTMLGNERGLAGDEWPGSAELAEVARRRGLEADPVTRLEVADVYIREQILRYLDLRVQSRLGAGESVGPLASILNLSLAELLRRSGNAGARVVGPALVAGGRLRPDGASGHGVGGPGSSEVEDRWRYHVLTAPCVRIASGTDEIQRNILGERGLGLPREPRPEARPPVATDPERN